MITSGRVVSLALLLVWLTVEGASGFLLAMALMIFAQSYVMAKAATDDDREWWQGSAEPQQGWWERQKQNLRDRQEQKRELEESRKKARVDELLEKVSRDGLDSLTREERTFLEKVSREFDRRD